MAYTDNLRTSVYVNLSTGKTATYPSLKHNLTDQNYYDLAQCLSKFKLGVVDRTFKKSTSDIFN